MNLQAAFFALGKVNGQVPDFAKNNEAVAWELYASYELQSWAKKRREEAIKVAIEDGVIFDHKAHPMEDGAKSVCYTSNSVQVSVVVKRNQPSVDWKLFEINLVKRGVKQKDIDAAKKASEREMPGAHTFYPIVIGAPVKARGARDPDDNGK